MEQASLVLLLSACSTPAAPGAAMTEEPAPWVAPSRPEARPAAPRAIDGWVRTMRGAPASNRRVLAIDGRGEHRDAASGPHGEFHLEDVSPPYDLRVGGTAWLGVTRVDPVIEIEGEETLVSEEVTVEVHAPLCGREPCLIDVVSVSPSGRGTASAVASPRGAPTTVVFHHESRAPEDIDVHALVHDAAFTSVAYARGDRVLEAAPVDTREVTAGEDARLMLDVPGGASFAIGPRIPQIEGATWRMERRAAAPVTKSLLHRSSRAWSGTQALDNDPPALPLPVGPAIQRPLAGGALSARGAGLSWDSDPSTLFTVDVADVARGAFRYRLVTNASDIPFGRVERLGFSRLRSGAHTFSLATAPFASVDEALSSDEVERTRRFDERRAGAATYETIPFTVTP